MKVAVVSVDPSYYFKNAIVIATSCGHLHLRPKTWSVRVGDDFDCCFDEHNTEAEK